MTRRLWEIVTHNPIPGIALIGLVFGAAARSALAQPAIAAWIWLGSLVVGGAPLVWATLRGMLRGSFASDVVAMLAIVTALILREYVAGLVIVLMQGGGEALDRYALRRASSTLERLLARAPRIAYRQDGEHLQQIDVLEVQIGDRLIVRPGDLLHHAGSVEQFSSHVLGQMVTQAARERCGQLALPANVRELPGRGVEGDLQGQHVIVGSPRLLAERCGEDALAPAVRQRLRSQPPGTLATLIGLNGNVAGIVQFRDRLRTGVPQLVARLRSLGVRRIVMLTGDSAENARTIAEEAGITEVEANVLPAGKVAVVQTLKQQAAPVVMVGDGINDAPVLATADVGIAMGAHCTAISAEAADIVLLVDDVTRVGEAIAIGQRTLRIAKQSILVGLGLSGLLMVIASTGIIPPTIGALAQEVVDVAVILNALRAR